MNYDLLYQKIGYRFKDIALLKLALTHRSASSRNNERLEFLGDSILNFIIAAELFHRYPQAKEGRLSRQRAGFVKKDMLAQLARELELSSFLRLGSGEMRTGGFHRESILANALEAIVGAMFLDSDFEACRACIAGWYGSRLESVALTSAEKDPKTKIQEALQGRQLDLPKYTVLSIEGEAHSQTFKVSCKTDLFAEPTEGVGSTRRKAEQHAAQLMLEKLDKSKK